MRILAVIPAYNEEECLIGTATNLVHECPDIEYVVINDGSTDKTWEIIEQNKLNGICLPINTGLSSAFKTGMKYAYRHNYDAVVQFDADGQHLPKYIPVMASIMEQEDCDIVIASRYLDGTVRPTGARGLGSRLISLCIKLTTGITITDPTSGMRMYSKRMIEKFSKELDLAPEPDAIALIARKNHSVREIQATMQERQGGRSYLKIVNVLKYMSRTCLSIIMLRFLR